MTFRSFVLFALLALLAAGCGPQKYNLRSDPRAPGADAVLTADIQKDQGRTALEFHVTNLAPPDRIEAGDTAFVAWYRKDDKTAWQRIGALKYDAESRSGSLASASVPETAFDMELTAEKNVDPASPSPTVIFQQRVEKKQ